MAFKFIKGFVAVCVFSLQLSAVFGQAPNTTPAKLRNLSISTQKQIAIQEIESVLSESGKIDDVWSKSLVKAKAAELLWNLQPEKAKSIFLDIWHLAEAQEDEIVKDEIQAVVFKYLAPKSPAMADSLLKESLRKLQKESSRLSQAAGTDPTQKKLARLARYLVESDSSLAAERLRQSLALGVTPAGIAILNKIREKNPSLANYVVTQTLETMKRQPTVISLKGLFLLTDYVFPMSSGYASSEEIENSDETLRFRYFFTAYEILKKSALESPATLSKDQKYTNVEVTFWSVYQPYVAEILAVLSPKFAPQLTLELIALAKEKSAGLTPDQANTARFIASRFRPNNPKEDDKDKEKDAATAVTIAVSKGDFETARKLLDEVKDENLKKVLAGVINKVEIKTLLTASQVEEALIRIRRLESADERIYFFAEAAEAAAKKKDLVNVNIALTEVRQVPLQTENWGFYARSLLLVTPIGFRQSKQEGVDFLRASVSTTNKMVTSFEREKRDVNNPRYLVETIELHKAFSAAGGIDYNMALAAANEIEDRGTRLISKLFVCDKVLKTKQALQSSKSGD
jgi:hypothetical protein